MQGFKNTKIYVEGQGVVKTNLCFFNGIISYIGDGEYIEDIKLPENAIVVPGFIDEHIHGANGSDAMNGTTSDLENISKSIASEGTTAFLATTMTQSRENIIKALSAIKNYKNIDGAEVIGVHLEGPFISVKHVGAQPLEHVQKPTVEAFKEYNSASGNMIKIVTIAPEVDGADKLIEYLSANNIVASIGHTDAGYNDVKIAIEKGAKNITHTYNAQKALHHREIGVVGSALLIDELNCEVICDGIHVSVPAMKLLVKNKPHEKVTLITDAMQGKNLPDGLSELGGQKVMVKNGEARLMDGTLAGSVLKMNVAVKNMCEKVGVRFTDAVDFATINPARTLNISDRKGSIKVGKDADFAVLDDNFNVLMTIKGGKIIYNNL